MTGPLPLRSAPGPVTFGRKKARAFPMGKPGHFETRILCLLSQSSVTVWLQHSRCSKESQAPFRLLRHHSKWADCPLNHHSAANTPRGQRTPNVQSSGSAGSCRCLRHNVCNAAPWQLPGWRPGSGFHGERTNNQSWFLYTTRYGNLSTSSFQYIVYIV